MAFGQRRLTGWIESGLAASELLFEGKAVLSLDETLALQAISHILSQRDTFFSNEVRKLTKRPKSGSQSKMLERFEVEFGLFESWIEDEEVASQHRGLPRRLYSATELGSEVLRLFDPSKK